MRLGGDSDAGGRERSLANAERSVSGRCIIRVRPEKDQTRLEHCTSFYGVVVEHIPDC
jgi:hypothetical protein